jgi:hypothetical protein
MENLQLKSTQTAIIGFEMENMQFIPLKPGKSGHLSVKTACL